MQLLPPPRDDPKAKNVKGEEIHLDDFARRQGDDVNKLTGYGDGYG